MVTKETIAGPKKFWEFVIDIYFKEWQYGSELKRTGNQLTWDLGRRQQTKNSMATVIHEQSIRKSKVRLNTAITATRRGSSDRRVLLEEHNYYALRPKQSSEYHANAGNYPSLFF